MLCTGLLTGCRKNVQNEEAVRQGIMNYLSKRSDLNSMDVRIVSVSFRKDAANAVVHFQAKGVETPGSGLDMSYALEQKGGEWIVKGRSGRPTGENPHGGAMTPSQALPPGHPAIPAAPDPAR